MKKGLTFALLMVAMVALAVPVSALAPVIQDLPSVIIGSAGDVSTEDTPKILLRYTNVFNLASPSVITQRNEPTDPSRLRVYYSTPSTTLKVSNKTSIIQPLTSAELTALQTAGTIPTAKVINTASDLWLSLIHVTGTAPANAAAATPEANGATAAALASTFATPAVVTLHATDETAATTKIGSESFVVYSVNGAEDSYSPIAEPVIEYTFEGSASGWTYASNSGAGTGLGTVPQITTATGVGFNASARTDGNVGFSSWYSPVNDTDIPASNMAGKVYRARLDLSGTAASSAAAPGYRVMYASLGFVHIGGYQVGSSDTAVNSPYSGNNVSTRAYWAVPTDLNAYGDSNPINGLGGLDLRSYYLFFDIVQMDASDAGTLILENLAVESIARPADVTPALVYGASGTAFNADTTTAGGWFVSTGTVPGYGQGSATLTANSISINMGTGTSGYKQVAPTSQSTVFPVWTSGKLYRVKHVVSCATPNTAPSFRMFLLPFTGATLASVQWADTISPSNALAYYAPAVSGLAGAPKAAGSTIENYYYGQNAVTATAYLVPMIDVAQPNNWNVNGWTRPAANLVFTTVSMEVLDN